MSVSELAVLTMSRIGWHKRSRPEEFPGLSDPPQEEGIHVYLFWTKEGGRYFSHTCGQVTAEELCISAAEAVGENDHVDQMHPHRSARVITTCVLVLGV